MKSKNDFLASFAADSQPMPGIPLVEVCGTRRVLIESHQGVIAYDENEILVKVRFGTICVSGQTLQLCKMCREQLVITGIIEQISLRRSG